MTDNKRLLDITARGQTLLGRAPKWNPPKPEGPKWNLPKLEGPKWEPPQMDMLKKDTINRNSSMLDYVRYLFAVSELKRKLKK